MAISRGRECIGSGDGGGGGAGRCDGPRAPCASVLAATQTAAACSFATAAAAPSHQPRGGTGTHMVTAAACSSAVSAAGMSLSGCCSTAS